WTFLGFLCHVQFNYLDFLPITWHAAMEQVGIGGTASLRERLVNISQSFVFKRVHPRHFPQHAKQTAESLVFKLLVKEIYVASHGDLFVCENVVNLEGVSWDIENDVDEKAWPVLVYEKAKYGSIKTFIEEKSSGLGIELGFSERLELCAQIARGIGCMHRAGIIHGDVKPDNVVIFGDSESGFTAKITDFGYSTVCIDIQDGSRLRKEGTLESGIYLTKPSTWSHPDRHDESYSFQEAVLEEVYTFGMTCFWVLF
ncbi:kinase-like protein, partial [Mytilinidion resinicola]